MVEQKIYLIDKPANSIVYPARLNGVMKVIEKLFHE